MQGQPGWLLPQIAAAGGDEQEREKPVESEVTPVSGWELRGEEGNKNGKQDPARLREGPCQVA